MAEATLPAPATLPDPNAKSGNALIDKSLQQAAKLLLLAWIVALLLTRTTNAVGRWLPCIATDAIHKRIHVTGTSSNALLNLPLALLAILSVRWLIAQLGVTQHSQPRQRRVFASDIPALDVFAELVAPTSPKPAPRPPPTDKDWRAMVQADLVATAWEKLCGSIIQEFIYDAWYTSLTPDREFPAEARSILNSAFGTLAQRARRIDMRQLLRDATDLLIQNLELYRDTRYSIWGNDPPQGDLAKRERALRNEMQADGNLHPALAQPSGQYRVLLAVSEGLSVMLLGKNMAHTTLARVFVRELLASCVLRPVMLLLTPYQINKMALYVLQEQVQRRQQLDAEDLQAITAAGAIPQKGYWEFEERLRQSAKLEDSVLAAKEVEQKQRSMKQAAYVEQQRAARAAAEAVREKQAAQATARGEGGGSEAPITADGAGQAAMGQGDKGGAAHSQGAAHGDAVHADASKPPSPSSHSTVEGSRGFRSRPKASVVAAELNLEGGREYVTYKIRVSDGTDGPQWTVARRFRNFEELHRVLRGNPAYKLKLPPKKVFFHNQTVDFVEERRHELDKYLSTLLLDSDMAGAPEVHDFLSVSSEVFETEGEAGFFSKVTGSVNDVRFSMRKSMAQMGGVIDDIDSKRKKSMAALSNTLSKRFETLPGISMPDMNIMPSVMRTISGKTPAPEPQQRPVELTRPRSPPETGSRPQSRPHSPPFVDVSRPHSPPPSVPSSASTAALQSAPQGGTQAALHGSASMPVPRDPEGHISSGSAPLLPPRGASMPALAAADAGHLSTPMVRQASGEPPSSEGLARQASHGTASTSMPRVRSRKDLADGEDDYTGISAPLYALVDSLFQLQSRGFFRQGVYSIARQALSLIAGSAIDEALVRQLNYIKQEHTIARLILRLQTSLWPGGRWFMTVQAAIAPGQGQTRHVSTPENFMVSTAPPPLDGDEIAAAVKQLLETKAPAALVTLLGKQAYVDGVLDLYEMCQSPTFVSQLGYGLLEVVFCTLFPEMQSVFRRFRR